MTPENRRKFQNAQATIGVGFRRLAASMSITDWRDPIWHPDNKSSPSEWTLELSTNNANNSMSIRHEEVLRILPNSDFYRTQIEPRMISALQQFIAH